MKKGYKECPFCGEEIKKAAIKCQYCGEFLAEEQQKDEENNSFFGFSVDEQLKRVIDEKDKETETHALLKGFDYIGWIIIIRCIIIVFKGYSTSPGLRRFIMGCYLIFWVFSVGKSICNNVKATKNINKLFRAILKVKEMLRNNDDKEKILDELDIRNILKQ